LVGWLVARLLLLSTHHPLSFVGLGGQKNSSPWWDLWQDPAKIAKDHTSIALDFASHAFEGMYHLLPDDPSILGLLSLAPPEAKEHNDEHKAA